MTRNGPDTTSTVIDARAAFAARATVVPAALASGADDSRAADRLLERLLRSDTISQNTVQAGENDVAVWMIPNEIMDLADDLDSTLDAGERAHADRMGNAAKARRFRTVRAILRLLLSRMAEVRVDAQDWTFTTNAYGRPDLQADQADLSFSITHADGFSAIAITRGATVGIDAERIDETKIAKLPTDCLTNAEYFRLRLRDADSRTAEFFKLWTLKEAYTKALGQGFSRAFNTVGFNLDRGIARDDEDANGESFALKTLETALGSVLLAVCTLDMAAPAAIAA